MDWLVSILTVLSVELVARKRWQGWVLGTVNQGLWAYLAVSRQMWGLLPMAGIMAAQSIWAMLRWRKSPPAGPRNESDFARDEISRKSKG